MYAPFEKKIADVSVPDSLRAVESSVSAFIVDDDLAEQIALAEMLERGLAIVEAAATVYHRADTVLRDGRDHILQILAVARRDRLEPREGEEHLEVTGHLALGQNTDHRYLAAERNRLERLSD